MYHSLTAGELVTQSKEKLHSFEEFHASSLPPLQFQPVSCSEVEEREREVGLGSKEERERVNRAFEKPADQS